MSTPVIKQYFSKAPFTRFILKDGTVCQFAHSTFRTNKKEVQDELDKEIAAMQEGTGGAYSLIYVKPEAHIVDSLVEDPHAGLRKRIEEEVRAKLLSEAAHDASKEPVKNVKLPEDLKDVAKSHQQVSMGAVGKTGMASTV